MSNLVRLNSAQIRAAYETDRVNAPRFGDGASPTISTRTAAKLRREVVPFSRHDLMHIGGSVAVVANPDPVLRYLVTKGEEEWRNMERADYAVKSGKEKRKHHLLSHGTEIVAAGSTPAAKMLHEFAIRNHKEINRLPMVNDLMMDAIFWGWRPFEVLWRPILWKGQTRWFQCEVHEKMPEDFAFTVDRDLVYQARLGEHKVLNTLADRYKWLVCTAGSTDNPYGNALYRAVWMLYYLKQRFMEMWSSGIQRSTGVVRAKQAGSGLGTAIFSGQPASQNEAAPGTPKNTMEIIDEVRRALADLVETGVLVERAGWLVEFLTDVNASEAWRHPLDYCDQGIELILTGQTLTSKIGDVGSKAATETHRDVLLTYSQSDGKLLESWHNDGLLASAIELNFGEVDPDDVPKFRCKISKQVSLERARQLFDMGAPLDGRRLAEEAGVPIIVEGDEDTPLILEKTQPMQVDPLTGMPLEQTPVNRRSNQEQQQGRPRPTPGRQQQDDPRRRRQEDPRRQQNRRRAEALAQAILDFHEEEVALDA